MVSKNHSWYVTETQDGVQHKEHGNYWSDTVLEALQREAECIMHRFAVTSLFHPRDQIKAMDGLLVEAVEWGRLLGEVGVT